MKSHPWDELNDSSKDYFDATGFTSEAEFDEEPQGKHLQRRRLTELRRRAEERLDWKRMYGDLELDSADEHNLLRGNAGTDESYYDDLMDD